MLEAMRVLSEYIRGHAVIAIGTIVWLASLGKFDGGKYLPEASTVYRNLTHWSEWW